MSIISSSSFGTENRDENNVNVILENHYSRNKKNEGPGLLI